MEIYRDINVGPCLSNVADVEQITAQAFEKLTNAEKVWRMAITVGFSEEDAGKIVRSEVRQSVSNQPLSFQILVNTAVNLTLFSKRAYPTSVKK